MGECVLLRRRPQLIPTRAAPTEDDKYISLSASIGHPLGVLLGVTISGEYRQKSTDDTQDAT